MFLYTNESVNNRVKKGGMRSSNPVTHVLYRNVSSSQVYKHSVTENNIPGNFGDFYLLDNTKNYDEAGPVALEWPHRITSETSGVGTSEAFKSPGTYPYIHPNWLFMKSDCASGEGTANTILTVYTGYIKNYFMLNKVKIFFYGYGRPVVHMLYKTDKTGWREIPYTGSSYPWYEWDYVSGATVNFTGGEENFNYFSFNVYTGNYGFAYAYIQKIEIYSGTDFVNLKEIDDLELYPRNRSSNSFPAYMY